MVTDEIGVTQIKAYETRFKVPHRLPAYAASISEAFP